MRRLRNYAIIATGLGVGSYWHGPAQAFGNAALFLASYYAVIFFALSLPVWQSLSDQD